MTHDSDILIAGGGLNGPVLALALAHAGFSVTLVDATPPTKDAGDFDGRAYAIAAGSRRMLARLGLWAPLAAKAQAMTEIKVTDGRAGDGPAPWWLHFDSAEIEDGPMGHMVEDRHLRAALDAALEAAEDVTRRAPETVVAQEVTPGGVSVTLGSGEVLRAGLLVGCDGRASGTAARAGIRRHGWGYGQTAITCAVEHALPHHGIAHQFFMPGGPLAILPLTGNRSSLVWSERTERAERIAALDDAGFLAALRPAFGGFLGEIDLVGARGLFPLGLSLAERLTGPRVALVGDAAHGLHPVAGQGLNAGLRDVAALAQVLREARQRGEDTGSAQVLERYARWRRFDTATLAATTDLTTRLFSNDNPLLRLARDAGMGAINAIAPLRRAMIREAAGLTGELPELMR
ncbi:UbiH/UbiF/VisC/COQ6 family ubiquinone biosynthesis hydroxylase [uncultured Limimaricola sp.]|uniref:UbiH/UbiF/VisC/COQ6 family ubiquinone biosynthesis hydroxylase n=1 Tax=uncultured Limimaricola sp. TaxID=2211667 RepID=UPI0030F628F9